MIDIKLNPTSNESRWKSVKNGDFLLIEGTAEHPIPNGLYRAFIMHNSYFLVPMFEYDFPADMFPYFISTENNPTYPTIVNTVNKISIEVQIA